MISLVAVGIAITGAGCNILPAETAPGAGSQGTESAGATAAPSTVQATPATTDMTPATGTEAFNPATEVSAMVTNGTVAKAVLEEKATGTPVAGELVVSGRKWISKNISSLAPTTS
ncbi:hypothetical protein NHF46_03595 [Arthrobacter alpinus]|nr:hypothetical protein [Arthrobacter alpinus]